MTGRDRRAVRLYESHGEKLRYLMVGAWNTVFSYVLFIGLLALLGSTLQALSKSTFPAMAVVMLALLMIQLQKQTQLNDGDLLIAALRGSAALYKAS